MQRWNGWGDTDIQHPIKPEALAFLKENLGDGRITPDADLKDVVETVPESRLAEHPLITTKAEERIRHATGQSLSDWVAFKSGQIPVFPDGVAYPYSANDVRELIRYALASNIKLIPYGGGTSVVGHINPIAGDAPVLTVDMGRMNQLTNLDITNHLATFGAGVSGSTLESQLRAQGYTLGHFPQSFEYSTLGGWIATRSSGQQSLRYGRIEDLFAGGNVETPLGALTLPPLPASSAGQDLRHIVMGSEGRIGIITQATMRISPLPETESFKGVFFPTFEQGLQAVREITQAKLPLSMLRLSNATETMTNLIMAGHKTAIRALESYVQWRGAEDEKCMMIFGVTGHKKLAKSTTQSALEIIRAHGGVYVRGILGNQWQKNRFKGAYLRNNLWEHGYAVDTLETATTWHNTQIMMNAIENALKSASQAIDEKIHVFTHISHVYSSGSSIYTTYIFRLGNTPDETLAIWRKLKTVASEAIVKHGGTISHQHGVGIDHAPYLHAEKGDVGMSTIRNITRHFDTDGMMNPQKLLTDQTNITDK